MLKAILDNATDGIIAVTPEGVVRSFNPAAERLFQYAAQDVIGQDVRMLMPDPNPLYQEDYLGAWLTTKQGEELPARRADGAVFFMELGISEVILLNDHFFVGLVRDISERKAAGQALRDQAAHLNAVMNTVVDGLITINARGIITSFNPAAEKIFGYTAAEAIGENVKFLMPEPHHGAHDGYLRKFAETGEKSIIGVGREVSARRKNGSVFPMDLAVSEMVLNGNRFYVGIMRDITARRQVEQQLQDSAAYLTAIMNTVVDGLLIIDERGTICSINLAAEKIFGYRSSEAEGQNVKFLMPEPYHSAHDSYLKKYGETGNKGIIGVGREVSARRKDGSVFPMDLAVGELFLHDRRLFVGIIRDISQRKHVETESLKLVASLKRSNQELDDFAYIASHDLKEPLRGLFNHATFLKEDYESQLEDAGIKRLDRIGVLCKRMEKLIDELLYFSRLGRQTLAYRQTDLNEVVNEVSSLLEASSELHRVRITICEPLPTVVCDSTRVKEVFHNLVTNAIKYNHRADKIIDIGCLENHQGEGRVFYVRDNGIGIARESYSDVFTIFKRLNPEDDAVRGSGVGLSLAQKIIERHGGKIWLDSEVGVGTTFFFTFKETLEL